MSKTFINFLPILTPLPSGVLWTSDSCGSVLPFFCWAVPSGMRTELGVLGLISKVPYARLTLLSVAPGTAWGPLWPLLQGLCKFWTRAVGKWIYITSFACKGTAVSLLKPCTILIWSPPQHVDLYILHLLAYFFRVFPLTGVEKVLQQ